MKKAFGIDLGTTTGVAWTEDGTVSSQRSEAVKFKPKRGESQGVRYMRFRRWLKETVDDPENTIVFYEWVHPAAHRSAYATQAYSGFLSILESYCEEFGVAYMGLGVGQIKKHATGNGAASKSKMLASAYTRFGALDSEDAADALWTLDLGLTQIDWEDFGAARDDVWSTRPELGDTGS